MTHAMQKLSAREAVLFCCNTLVDEQMVLKVVGELTLLVEFYLQGYELVGVVVDETF